MKNIKTFDKFNENSQDNSLEQEISQKYGYDDEELKDHLQDLDFSEFESQLEFVECAQNCGYVWSDKLQKWFDENQSVDQEYQEYFDQMIDGLKSNSLNEGIGKLRPVKGPTNVKPIGKPIPVKVKSDVKSYLVTVLDSDMDLEDLKSEMEYLGLQIEDEFEVKGKQVYVVDNSDAERSLKELTYPLGVLFGDSISIEINGSKSK